MRYLYQKDERALPGNLQNRKYSFLFPPPPNVGSLTTSPLSSLSLGKWGACVCRTEPVSECVPARVTPSRGGTISKYVKFLKE
jgi:hypothetical protein